jgi:RNA recognition motif-containing protein
MHYFRDGHNLIPPLSFFATSLLFLSFNMMQLSVAEHFRSLFLGNLAFACTENDLLYLFQSYGKIESIRLIKNKETQSMVGYGFITFIDYQSALLAATELNGKIFIGRDLR